MKTVLADPRSPIPVQFASGTAEEHEFYQARVRLFTGCVFLISGSFYLIDVAFSAPALGVDIAVLWAPKLFHLAATILAGTIWLVLRSPRSMAFLNRLDAAATIVLSAAAGGVWSGACWLEISLDFFGPLLHPYGRKSEREESTATSA